MRVGLILICCAALRIRLLSSRGSFRSRLGSRAVNESTQRAYPEEVRQPQGRRVMPRTSPRPLYTLLAFGYSIAISARGGGGSRTPSQLIQGTVSSLIG